MFASVPGAQLLLFRTFVYVVWIIKGTELVIVPMKANYVSACGCSRSLCGALMQAIDVLSYYVHIVFMC